MSEKVIKIINEFINEVNKNEPKTIYEAYKSSNEREFIHLITFLDHDSELRHAQSDYTRKFIEQLHPCCEIPPQFKNLYLVS